jgi:hypothetical protein
LVWIGDELAQLIVVNSVLKFLLRLLLISVGLIFTASLLVVMLVLMSIWLLRLLWAKLTGQAVAPFVMRMNPRHGFGTVFRHARHSESAPKRDVQDVTDVQPKVK